MNTSHFYLSNSGNRRSDASKHRNIWRADDLIVLKYAAVIRECKRRYMFDKCYGYSIVWRRIYILSIWSVEAACPNLKNIELPPVTSRVIRDAAGKILRMEWKYIYKKCIASGDFHGIRELIFEDPRRNNPSSTAFVEKLDEVLERILVLESEGCFDDMYKRVDNKGNVLQVNIEYNDPSSKGAFLGSKELNVKRISGLKRISKSIADPKFSVDNLLKDEQSSEGTREEEITTINESVGTGVTITAKDLGKPGKDKNLPNKVGRPRKDKNLPNKVVSKRTLKNKRFPNKVVYEVKLPVGRPPKDLMIPDIIILENNLVLEFLEVKWKRFTPLNNENFPNKVILDLRQPINNLPEDGRSANIIQLKDEDIIQKETEKNNILDLKPEIIDNGNSVNFSSGVDFLVD